MNATCAAVDAAVQVDQVQSLAQLESIRQIIRTKDKEISRLNEEMQAKQTEMSSLEQREQDFLQQRGKIYNEVL